MLNAVLRLLYPRPQLSRHHQPEHLEVADERPPRMPKAGRLVPLNKKVPCPREAVCDRYPEKRPPRVPQGKRGDDRQQPQRRPTRMQQPIAPLAMLPHVKSEELVVAVEVRRPACGVHRGKCASNIPQRPRISSQKSKVLTSLPLACPPSII